MRTFLIARFCMRSNRSHSTVLYFFRSSDRLLTKVRVITILAHEKRVPKITNDGIITNTDAVFLLKE